MGQEVKCYLSRIAVHAHLGAIYLSQSTSWYAFGRKERSQRKLTQAQGEHAHT